jgi:hypothetical protein
MARLGSILIVSSAVLFAVACSESPTQPSAASPTPTVSFKKDGVVDDEFDSEGNKSERHSFELANSPGVGAARAARTGSGTGISYHGGPVLQSATNLVAVYWGSSSVYANGPAAGTTGAASGDNSLVGYFLAHLGGSPYFNINTTYKDGAGAAIKNVVNYNGFWASTTSVPANGAKVTDAQMIAMLQSGFTNGKLTYAANTLYLIFSAGTVNLGGGFGTSYCAYHTHATVSVPGQGNKVIYYAAMPYVAAYPSACTNGTPSPNGDAAADGVISVLAHEIEETTTDPMGNAWYDSRGYENADKCAWNFGTTQTNGSGGVWNITVGAKNFLVQQNWINSGSGGCRLSW